MSRGDAARDGASSSPSRWWNSRLLEPVLVTVAALLAVGAVHDVAYVLRTSYWLDESWVAVSRRFPLPDLRSVTSSTPIGWTFLTRLFPDGGQAARLLPLLFAAGTVVAAWFLGRGAGWRTRSASFAAGTLAALAALLSPAMLVRDDLKQYTADACLAILLLALLCRFERAWTRRRLAVLVVVAVAGMLLSHATLFVAVPAFASLCAVEAVRRNVHRLVEAGVAAVVALVGMTVVYAVVDAPALVPSLTDYWRDYWLPLRPGAALRFLGDHVTAVVALVGTGTLWSTCLLALAGLVTLCATGRPVTALTVVLLAPEMVAASAVHKYPLLDLRTSTFLLVAVAVTAALGAVGLAVLLGRVVGRARVLVPVVLAGAAVAAVVGAAPYVRSHPIPDERVRQQVATIHAERRPGDVVLVNASADWGFGYYWREGPVARVPSRTSTVGFTVAFPGQRDVVVAADSTPAAVAAAFRDALAQARATSGARVWLLRTHLGPAEDAAWQTALADAGVVSRPVGDSGVLLLVAEGF